MPPRLLAATLIFFLSHRALAQEPFAKTGVAFLQKYCTDCHGEKKQKADLSLHIYRDDVSVLKQRKVWKHVIDAVQDEEMPPDDKPQPTKAERDAFIAMTSRS